MVEQTVILPKKVEVLLGPNPLNFNDHLAAPMFSIFTSQPDLTPYMLPPPSTHLTAEDQKRNQQLGNQR